MATKPANDRSRQSFLGGESHKILEGARVAIVGLGGGGSHVAQQLAHVGVGNLTLIDHDTVEDSNLNRLIGGQKSDVTRGTRKVDAVARLARGINPEIAIDARIHRWEETHFSLRDCTVVFGCVDSFLARDQLEKYCRRYLLPYIDVGMDVHTSPSGHSISGQVVISIPDNPCFRCLGFLSDSLITAEVQRYGGAGPRPQVVWSNGLLASIAVGQFVRMVTPWRNPDNVQLYLEYDGNAPGLMPSRLPSINPTVTCRHFQSLMDLGDVVG